MGQVVAWPDRSLDLAQLRLVKDHVFSDNFDKVVGGNEAPISFLYKTTKHVGNVVVCLESIPQLFSLSTDSAHGMMTALEKASPLLFHELVVCLFENALAHRGYIL